jgi:hypothetical protein
MINRKSMMAPAFVMVVAFWATAAMASEPIKPEIVAVMSQTLPQCTGSQWRTGTPHDQTISATELAPRLALLAKPSSQLTDEQGSDLYAISKAFLRPAVEPPSWMPDGNSFLKCPAKPKEAVALMEYLAGDGPGEVRGAVNIFDWLGLAYETGAGVNKNIVRAKRFYLISRMHWTFQTNDRWSDGIDKNLLANIDRAGLRPFLNRLAAGDRWGAAAARLILAEAALATDPSEARRLLAYNDHMTLLRLVELENAGRFPIPTDGSDVNLWAEAWRTLFYYDKWAARLIKAVSLANGGTLPTSSERPGKGKLVLYLDKQRVTDAYGTKDPIPMRALVDRTGRALYVEGCRATPQPWKASGPTLNVLLDASRLYNHLRLPPMPVPQVNGRPAYGWVILPAVHFQRSAKDELKIELIDVPSDKCAFSAMMPPPVWPVVSATQ